MWESLAKALNLYMEGFCTNGVLLGEATLNGAATLRGVFLLHREAVLHGAAILRGGAALHREAVL
jgi:hypothetical protein